MSRTLAPAEGSQLGLLRHRPDPVRILRYLRLYKVGPLIVLGVVLYLVLAPLAIILLASLKPGTYLPTEPAPFTLANYSEVYLRAETYQILGNSLIFAGGSVAIAFIITVPISWVVARTDYRWKRYLFILTMLPMALPGFLYAITWTFLLNPRTGLINRAIRLIFPWTGDQGPLDVNSLYGLVLVEGLRLVPSLFLMTTAALRLMDPTLEEASASCGGRMSRTIRYVTAPLMTPALMGAAIFFFVVAIESFDVPGIIGLNAGIKLLSTDVYFRSHPTAGLPNYGGAAAVATILMLIGLTLISIYRRVTRNAARYSVVRGKAYRSRILRVGRLGPVISVVFTLYAVISIGLPLAVLAWGSIHNVYVPITGKNFSSITLHQWHVTLAEQGLSGAIWHTVTLVLVSASALTVLAFAIGWSVVRARGWLSPWIDGLSFLPIAIPGIVVGLALLIFYLSFPSIKIYGTVWILIVAIVTKFLSYASRATIAGLLQIHPELEEAARVSGGSLIQNTWSITAPLLKPVLISLWIWVAIQAVRDISTVVLITGPKSEVLSTMLWNFWLSGRLPEACVLGIVLIAASGLLLFVASLIGGGVVGESGRVVAADKGEAA